MSQQVHPQASARIFGAQLANLRRQQGRLEELETALTYLLAQQLPSVASQRVGLALLYSELGREVEARREFIALATHDFADLPRDQAWLVSIAFLAQVCAFLADTQHAATLYEFLQPYRRLTIVGGNIGTAICIGAASRYLGLLAATLPQWEEAEQHFRDALAMNTRLGARPYVAHTQHEYARMLLARHHPGDREKALELLDRALATAQELGMKGLEGKIQELEAKGWVLGEERTEHGVEPPDSESQTPNLRSLTPTAQHPTPSTQHPASNVFRREGAYWTLIHQGTTCRLKDAKGLHYVAILLRHVGREFHAVDLTALTASRPTTSVATRVEKLSSGSLTSQDLSIATGRGEAGSMLDAQARTAYRRRLEDLRDELEEAERFHDPGRAAKAQAEIDFITRELAAVYGLRGRSRKSGSDSEKARQAVGYCIRSSLNKIRTMHPALWRHLFAALKTGTFCSYNPEHPTAWEL